MQKAEGRRRKAEGGRRKAEGGMQKAEGRRQKAEGRRLETVWHSPFPILCILCFFSVSNFEFPYCLLPTAYCLLPTAIRFSPPFRPSKQRVDAQYSRAS